MDNGTQWGRSNFDLCAKNSRCHIDDLPSNKKVENSKCLVLESPTGLVAPICNPWLGYKGYAILCRLGAEFARFFADTRIPSSVAKDPAAWCKNHASDWETTENCVRCIAFISYSPCKTFRIVSELDRSSRRKELISHSDPPRDAVSRTKCAFHVTHK
jgi:hypothetical protein